MAADKELVEQLLALLRGGQAHVTLEGAAEELEPEFRGIVPEGLPYSAWQIVEHMRITQRDILDFCAPPTGGYQPMEWPGDYWSKTAEPQTAWAWDDALAALVRDREAFEALLQRPGVDLYKPFRWGEGQNLLREALLIADHSAYHTGELVVLRRLLGAWPV